MNGRFSNPFVSELEEPGIRPENDLVSSLSGGKMSDTSSPKRRLVADPETGFAGSVRSRRRAVQKRVVSVPIADVEGSRAKGEGAPPSDSWAWRKYGQKPIKGSPYPRGYYRCSSSKGCPARKQVERSHVDPTMLVVTYACEHNHPWPAARNSGNNAHANNAAPRFPPREPAVFSTPPEPEPEHEPDEKFADLEGDPPLLTDDFGWFSDVTSSPTEIAVLESPFYSGSDADVAGVLFPMREEDESMFADLGELPECSVVFRRGFCEEEESRRCSLRCGSTG